MRRRVKANGSAHEEWLLDEAIKETFPASDPVSPYWPGSVTLSHARDRTARRARRALPRFDTGAWLVVAGALLLVAYVTRRRR